MKPHRMDGVSLSFGMFFLLVALWWAVARIVDIQLPAAGWLVAGGLIVFGVIGLAGALRSGRTAPVSAPPGPALPVAAEVPGDLPPEVHASIVRELLTDPAEQFSRRHPDQSGEDQTPSSGSGADSGRG
ncbi:MAG TPA: hypothetical protein VGB74_16645 [Actinoplanes sp.]|jgi:hypothetical protein